ncbi:MAG: DUF4349 domain-containing protein, partial [Oscillibacter sp.]|nr:DUF4349 domain-containing protein [Oscillibacter sp.]
MKRRIFTVFLVFALLGTLAACGGRKAMEEADYAPAPEAPMEAAGGYFADADKGVWDTEAASQNASGTSAAALATQKMIRTANLNLETTDFESTVAALTGLTESLDGYLENVSQGSGSAYRWASFTVRVPAERFQNFLTQAGAMAHETWRSVDQQNITESYYDTEGRLNTQKIKLERLQKLLSEAEDMADIITIESAISDTEWQIEDLSGTLRHYDSLVDYATIYVQLNEVYKYSNVELVPKSFGERVGSALSEGWNGFVSGMESV